MQEGSNQANWFNWFKKYQWIATWLIALAAIVGATYSVVTSRKTSQTLENVAGTIDAVKETLTTPLVGVKEIELNRPPGDPSCDKPPVALVVVYHNPLIIPVQIHHVESTMWWGEKKLEPVERRGPKEGATRIMTKDMTKQFIHRFSDYLRQRLSKSDDMWKSPFMKVYFEIIYSRVNDEQKFKYYAYRTIGYDCRKAVFRVQVDEDKSYPLE